jgi:hypothetical protein
VSETAYKAYQSHLERWNAARDAWMSKLICDFLDDHRKERGATAVCFIGADHARGIALGARCPVLGFNGIQMHGATGIQDRHQVVSLCSLDEKSPTCQIIKRDDVEFFYLAP